jgi:hypothetical protein
MLSAGERSCAAVSAMSWLGGASKISSRPFPRGRPLVSRPLRARPSTLSTSRSPRARREARFAPPWRRPAASWTEHTAKLVSGFFQLRDLGKLTVKGVKELVRVYELQGLGRLRTRLEVSRARGFTKFVGRHSEMATLGAALERAIAGNAQVVGVVAEPGVGKSRLCYEFAERSAHGRSPSTRRTAPRTGRPYPARGDAQHLSDRHTASSLGATSRCAISACRASRA